jgi:phage terminase Nu1 subunit (DNA packaging protein)
MIAAILQKKAANVIKKAKGDSPMSSKNSEKPQPVVGRAALAGLLGVSITTVDNWRRRGVPVRNCGKRTKFVVSEVVNWLRERDVEAATASVGQSDGAIDLGELRKRRALVDTELAELALEEARDQVVPIDIVIEEVSDSFLRIRSKLLAMKTRYAGRWTKITTVPKMKAAIEEAVFEILDELSSPEAVADKAAVHGRRSPRVRGASKARSSRRRARRPPAVT